MLRTLLIVALGGGVGFALRRFKVCARQHVGSVPLSHVCREHRRLFAHRLVLRTRCTRTPWQQHHNAAAYHRLVRRLHHVLHVLQREHSALAWRQRFRRPTLHRQQHVLRTACRDVWIFYNRLYYKSIIIENFPR